MATEGHQHSRESKEITQFPPWLNTAFSTGVFHLIGPTTDGKQPQPQATVVGQSNLWLLGFPEEQTHNFSCHSSGNSDAKSYCLEL